MKHVKAFTYAPKIPAVLDGTCRQTIRPYKVDGENDKRLVRPGDSVLFHGWTGRPYASPWSWRMQVEVKSVWIVEVRTTCDYDVWIHPVSGSKGEYPVGFGWKWAELEWLAEADGLEPPTWHTLEKFLSNPGHTHWQVIRW